MENLIISKITKKLRKKWSNDQPTGQEIIDARIIATKNMQK